MRKALSKVLPMLIFNRREDAGELLAKKISSLKIFLKEFPEMTDREVLSYLRKSME